MAKDTIINETKPSTPAVEPLTPIRIEIGGKDSQPYKSIDHVVWENVPAFAVLTGLNGSGKTQLLEILAHRLTGTWNPQLGPQTGTDVTITGDAFGPDSVAYIPGRWELGGSPVLGIAQMQEAKRQLYDQLRHDHVTQHNIGLRTMRAHALCFGRG
jgi:hypothetical protein